MLLQIRRNQDTTKAGGSLHSHSRCWVTTGKHGGHALAYSNVSERKVFAVHLGLCVRSSLDALHTLFPSSITELS